MMKAVGYYPERKYGHYLPRTLMLQAKREIRDGCN